MIQNERRLALGIFITALFAYLLTSGREPPWGDGHVQYMAARSLVYHGGLDVPKPWPDDIPAGPDGRYYSTYPLLTSLVQVPAVFALKGVAAFTKDAHRFAEPIATHLAPAFFGALTCLLFFRLCRQRGFDLAASSLATAALAFATTIWVYARYSYSEIAQAAFFTGFLLDLLRLDEARTPARARRLGLWAGLLISSKYIYGVALLGAAVLLLLRMRGRLALRLGGWAVLTTLPFVAAALIYNHICWGSPLRTGYSYFSDYWGENPLVGLWGMFLSPGKSLLLYSPPLLLGLAGLPLFLRRHRFAALAVLATAGPVLLVYAYYKLNGDYAWGPRFTVFAVPALALPLAALLDAWRRAPTQARSAIVAGTVAIGVAVQLLGNAFYWDHFIRISMDARASWLGKPDRSGAVIPTRSDGRCDSCFEDVHQLEWLPPFQPILGHLWLARSRLAGRDWAAAEADAPWRRHTSLQLDIASAYQRVRLDWWGMLWLRDFTRYRAAGLALLVLFTAGTATGAMMWIRRTRRATAEARRTAP
jgi:hypothetical protein